MTFLFNAEHPRGKSFPVAEVEKRMKQGWQDSPVGLESTGEEEPSLAAAVSDPDLEAVAKSLDEQKKLLVAREKEISAREKAVEKAEANLAEQVKAFNEQVEAANKDAPETKEQGQDDGDGTGDSDEANTDDDLTKIKGIGETKAKKLQDAGVTSYKQIAEMEIDQMDELKITDEHQALALELATG